MSQSEVQLQLQILRKSYTDSLPARLLDIEQKWQILLFNWDVNTASETLRLCHSLAGSASTFGFPEVTEKARHIEQQLAELDLAQMPTSTVLTTLKSSFKQLKAVPLEPDECPIRIAANYNPSPANNIVYVVDEDSDYCLRLKTSLNQYDLNVKAFNSLDLLKHAFKEYQPCVILMNTRLITGGSGGKNIIEQLKLPQLVSTPVFFMSDQEDIQTRLQAFQAGGSAFFTKPFEIQELIEKINLLTVRKTTDPFRILLIDDDQILIEHYTHILQSVGCVVHSLNNPLKIMEELVDFRPDVLLLDIYMTTYNGIELAGALRQQDAFTHLPIIFLSGELDINQQFNARASGGDDFLIKPINEKHLVASVINRAQRARQILSLICSDSMTGLLTHNKLLDEIDKLIHVVDRHQSPLVIALFDLDNFKRVNDTYSHLAGDKVIRAFANLLKKRLRRGDIAGRFGGEEFGIILPNTTLDTAISLLNEIRTMFAQLKFSHNGQSFLVTVSAGVAAYQHDLCATKFLERVDIQLYRAKTNGRNQIAHE